MDYSKISLIVLIFHVCFSGISQERTHPTLISQSVYAKEVAPLYGKNMRIEKARDRAILPKIQGVNQIVPGKGLPKTGDPQVSKQKNYGFTRNTKAPKLVFQAAATNTSPSDPTGAIGPNHYVSARNFSFSIFDRKGANLTGAISLSNIFENETLGDPIVLYDSFADRFVITQFSNTPNGILIAVSKGPDPLSNGWYTYRFNTGEFPDYPKISVWSDGYYITTNKIQAEPETHEIVYVVERERMLKGEEAKIVGFPLPGAIRRGFYSPASFHATGTTAPPIGNAKILFFQDDAWEGVLEDAIKLWTIQVDWLNPLLSTIRQSESFTVNQGDISSFDSTFDGGSFSNIPQPSKDASDLDVLQGAVMYATNYRRFCDYNAVVFNFSVDIDDRANSDNVSAIRWYELRQESDTSPWKVYQEGTYASPEGKSAWCGSMALDMYGNIALGYTTMGTIENGARQNSFVALRYTGRLVDDPRGIMTFAEQTVKEGNSAKRTGGMRYGDYAHMTVDPLDQKTFWYIGEYFDSNTPNVQNAVGVFDLAPLVERDIGVIQIDNPQQDFSATQNIITVQLQNFGTLAQRDFPISYRVQGGELVTEIFNATINPAEIKRFAFATPATLSGQSTIRIEAFTALEDDQFSGNDCSFRSISPILSSDIGVYELIAPSDKNALSNSETVTIAIKNYGTADQSNFAVYYQIDSNEIVEEIFDQELKAGMTMQFSFSEILEIDTLKRYRIETGTRLESDEQRDNDRIFRDLNTNRCKPTSNCKDFGDGIIAFELANIKNIGIPCTVGYMDFTDQVIALNRAVGVYSLVVQAGFANAADEKFSLWIDFNDNLEFESNELLIDNQILESKAVDLFFGISLSADSTLGKHILRIRAGDTTNNEGALLNSACKAMNFGTTHDYSVWIRDEPQNNQSELAIYSKRQNQFLFTLFDSSVSNVSDRIRVSIFSISGKIMATNWVSKDSNGRFLYPLDMSFAERGVYFIRFDTKDSKSGKFIVR